MVRTTPFSVFLISWFSLAFSCIPAFSQEEVVLKRVPSASGEFGSSAVVVEEGTLLHTAQIFPVDEQGKVTSDKLVPQLQQVLATLGTILHEAGKDESSVVRLQINMTDSAFRNDVVATLEKYWGEKPAPSLSFVQGKLPIDGVLVAIDAVAALPTQPSRTQVELLNAPKILGLSGPAGAVLPSSRVIHVAGQAEKGGDARESTRNTLNHLKQTLEWQGASWRDAVSIKCFLTPIESAPMVIEEIDAACGEHRPPVVFVEWQSSIPIEIEVVASAASTSPDLRSDGGIRYLTPPDMTASPVYSRMVVTNGVPVYVSGLLAQQSAAGDPELETRDLFRQLQEILAHADCGSDLKHLVKATYYCSHDSTSGALNAVRPDYYDPARPPAASKAIVPGVGHPHRRITLDMIAVRKPRN